MDADKVARLRKRRRSGDMARSFLNKRRPVAYRRRGIVGNNIISKNGARIEISRLSAAAALLRLGAGGAAARFSQRRHCAASPSPYRLTLPSRCLPGVSRRSVGYARLRIAGEKWQKRHQAAPAATG
jgi:hypothetical protein